MNKRLTTEKFINRSKFVHGDKYDYSLVDFKHSHIKVKIICSIHGVFEQLPHNHLNGGGCKKCNKAYKLTNFDFIEKSKKIHGDKYDYSLTEYKNNRKNVKIICQIHGVFEQLSGNHLKGMGCVKCSIENRKITFGEFLKMAKKIHKNKYLYSMVNYINFDTKIKIICPVHGVFEQNPRNHIRAEQGCPICKESKGERKIREYLGERKIDFVCQKMFKGCKNKRSLKFDFYLSKYNVCIEFDGSQHFERSDYFGGIEEFKRVELRDKIKNEYCKNNNIRLFRIKYDEDIIESMNQILNDIKF